MRLRRSWVLALFFYVALDFTDPGIPGVFFFDSDNLFLDGIINTSSVHESDQSITLPAPAPMAPRLQTIESPEHAAVVVTAVARRPASRSVPRSHAKIRYDAPSLSSSAEDH